MPQLTSLDHLVLTVADIAATVEFYETALGMTASEFHAADGTIRTALSFGNQKINLHQVGSEFKPNAKTAVSGSADLCFLSDTALSDWQTHLLKQCITIEEGPVNRSGAAGPIVSIYIRDPDGNLLEISNAV